MGSLPRGEAGLRPDRDHLRWQLKMLVERAVELRVALKAEEEADVRRDAHRAMAIVYLGHAIDALDCAGSELGGKVTP